MQVVAFSVISAHSVANILVPSPAGPPRPRSRLPPPGLPPRPPRFSAMWANRREDGRRKEAGTLARPAWSRQNTQRLDAPQYNLAMADRVIHISEAEAVSDFAGLLARVRAGAEVVIESGKLPVAVIHAPLPPRHTISECTGALARRLGRGHGR
jgi:antitoxin (DNA-binding transcriptional repressor) of toxin-antitoxin stability system